MPKYYQKVYNRDLPLYVAQSWYWAEHKTLPSLLNQTVKLSPLFIYQKGKGTDIYYEIDADGTEINPYQTLIEYFQNNPKKVFSFIKKYKKLHDQYIGVFNAAKVNDLKNLMYLHRDHLFPLACSFSQLGKNNNKEYKKITKAAQDIREWNDKLIYLSATSIYKLIQKKFKTRSSLPYFLTFNEVINGEKPAESEFRKRKNLHILYKGKLSTPKSITTFLKEKNIEIIKTKKQKLSTISGTIAQKGFAEGKVRQVFTWKDVKKVKRNEIIVSPMTTPDFLPALKKAAAIVTDEGGITCHAAIAARELKIPCIIGTNIATEVLKTGTKVKVNASEGTVQVLTKT